MTATLTATDLTSAPRVYSNETYDVNVQILKVFTAELNDLKGKKTAKAEKRRAELETLTKAARAACDANPQRYSSSCLAAEILASLSGMHSDATARCAATIAEMQTSLLYTLEWRFDDLVNWQTTIKFINWIWTGINKQILAEEGSEPKPVTLAMVMQAIEWATDLAKREGMRNATSTNLSTNPVANLIERYQSAYLLKITTGNDFGSRFCWSIEMADRMGKENRIQDDSAEYTVTLPALS